MEYVHHTTDFQFHNTVVSLGKFDGIHLGHRMLMDYMLSQKKKGLMPAAFTFSVDPGCLLSGKAGKVIYTEQEKRIRMEEAGVDIMISYPFNEETVKMEAEQFVRDILVKQLDAKMIVTGSDFGFGYRRKGNVELLRRLSAEYGYELAVFDKLSVDGTIVSSTAIRELLAEGKIEAANRLLLRPYFIYGEIVHGNEIGRTLGMPTANLYPPSWKLLVPNGVYVTKTYLDGRVCPGITNIGYKPTVGGEKWIGVETYLFDLDEDLYGKHICVELYEYVRGERKFSSLEELKVQMYQDMEYGKRYLAGHGE